MTAVQSLMLAARCEGLGTGWVSILEPEELRRALELSEGVEAVAVLCVGHVDRFEERPELESAGWAERADLAGIVRHEVHDGPVVDLGG
ncbi:MAG: nitroreductase family protein [Planctomycetota bacterium]|nr:nitroreductase family protein [Planctomycetota bacterium]